LVAVKRRRYTKHTYLGNEINGSQSGLIVRRYDLFEGRLKRKGFFYPHTIGKREARSASRSSIFEDDGNELRGEGVEMIYGFKMEKVQKLLLCRTFRASSDYAENNLYRDWRKHNVVLVGIFREEMFSHRYGNICVVGD
jgi:hypothetical protein